jgi:hypothetical protein
MPTNHVSLQDSTTHFPDGLNNDITKTFDAPGLNTNTRPYVSYRVTPAGGDVTLQMDLNGTLVVDDRFQTTNTRTLNEIIDHGVAVEGENDLVIRREAGPGTLDVSDIIFAYSQTPD